jgi:hypothetical protein
MTLEAFMGFILLVGAILAAVLAVVFVVALLASAYVHVRTEFRKNKK